MLRKSVVAAAALRDSETGLILMSGYIARPAPVKTAAQRESLGADVHA
jgi:hypothetical protein